MVTHEIMMSNGFDEKREIIAQGSIIITYIQIFYVPLCLSNNKDE